MPADIRRTVVIANWKMYKTCRQAAEFLDALPQETRSERRVDLVLCPPFTALETLGHALRPTSVALGAQNVHWAEEGAYTGEISPLMLRDLGVTYVLVGHSERRQYFCESDETVNKRSLAALAHELIPVICVGESLDQREAGHTDDIVYRQVALALAGVTVAQIPKLVFAYEPIWAIGTGKTCAADEANRVIGLIRHRITSLYTPAAAQAVSILYGGSVKPDTMSEQMAQPQIDGALVGGASLEPKAFATIVAKAVGSRQ